MFHRIRRSWFLIVACAIPGTILRPPAAARTAPTIPGTTVLPLDELVPFLADPYLMQVPTGGVSLFIPDILPIAAPLLLFRLKRTCLSHCRVVAVQKGLMLQAEV